jgi:hypothetical protein
MPRKTASEFATVSNAQETVKSPIWVRQHPTTFAKVTTTAKAWRAGESRCAPWERRKMVRTVRLDHLRTALLAVAAAGLLVAVGLVILYAQPAEANYPGKPGKIAYSGDDGNDLEIYTGFAPKFNPAPKLQSLHQNYERSRMEPSGGQAP